MPLVGVEKGKLSYERVGVGENGLTERADVSSGPCGNQYPLSCLRCAYCPPRTKEGLANQLTDGSTILVDRQGRPFNEEEVKKINAEAQLRKYAIEEGGYKQEVDYKFNPRKCNGIVFECEYDQNRRGMPATDISFGVVIKKMKQKRAIMTQCRKITPPILKEMLYEFAGLELQENKPPEQQKPQAERVNNTPKQSKPETEQSVPSSRVSTIPKVADVKKFSSYRYWN